MVNVLLRNAALPLCQCGAVAGVLEGVEAVWKLIWSSPPAGGAPSPFPFTRRGILAGPWRETETEWLKGVIFITTCSSDTCRCIVLVFLFLSSLLRCFVCLFMSLLLICFHLRDERGREGNQVCPAEALLFVLELYVCVVHTESNPCD